VKGPGQRPAFVADAMLGRLAKALRMLGYDVAYDPAVDDASLKLTAVREGRIVLTRDHEVAATSLPIRVVLVESDRPAEQLRQVVDSLGLTADGAAFSRCLICNVEVLPVEKREVEGLVPPYVYATQDRFARCPSCGRIYWPATHVEHALAWIEDALTSGKDGDE
jgi:uncharacterized protein with PIN domain